MTPKASILDEKLASLFAEAVGGAVDSLRDLRESVCIYVEAERARGVPLEEVIARVGAMLEKVRQAGPVQATLTPASAAGERELAREMVHWCVDSYLPIKARKKS